jgi:hypothetical protein
MGVGGWRQSDVDSIPIEESAVFDLRGEVEHCEPSILFL